MINQTPKMKPQLCFSKEIDSSHALRQFSVKNYNHLSKFKIVREPTPTGPGPYGVTSQIPEFRKLNQIASSLKSVKSLDLSRFKAQNFNAGKFKLFLKQFYKIQQFFNPWGEKTNDRLPLCLLIFQKAKYLRDLYLQASFCDLTTRFLSRMSLCKIRTLHFNQSDFRKERPEMLRVLFDSFPPTLENFSLFSIWDGSLRGQQEIKIGKFQFPSSVKNLQKLELRLRLGECELDNLLRSISDPSKLKCLRFNIVGQGGSGKIGAFLEKCVNLEVLEMRTGTSTKTSFYSGAVNLKLKKLIIEQHSSKGEDLRELENLLHQQRDSLESLSLNFQEIWSEPSRFGHLFGRIKLLKNLRKLQLGIVSSGLQCLLLPTYEPLTEIVGALNCLEEIDFEQVEVDFKKEKRENFEKFCKALSCWQALKSLKLSLTGCPYPEILIQQTLERLPKLEELRLWRIVIVEISNFYDHLREIVCEKSPYLNTLVITEERREYRKEERFVPMLKGIIRKSSMKNFEYSARPSRGFQYFSGKIELPEIIKQVHHFKTLDFPEYISQPQFNKYILDDYKWS